MLPVLPGCQEEDNTVYALTQMQRVDKDGEILYEEYLTFDENGRVTSSGSNEPMQRANSTFTYAEDGHRIYEFREGSDDYKAEMVIDENLRLTQITYPNTNEENQKLQRYTYAYDEAGRLMTRTWYVDQQKHNIDTYIYQDGACVKVEHTGYSEGYDLPTSRIYYVYNKKGDLIAYRDDNQGVGNKGYDVVNTYDWRGNLTRTETKNLKSDREPEIATYTYNWRGQMTSREWYDILYTFTYDQQGRLASEYWQGDFTTPSFETTVKFTYDDQGNLATREYTKTYEDGTQDYWKETYTYTPVELTGINRAIYELLKLQLPDLSPYTDRLKEIPVR